MDRKSIEKYKAIAATTVAIVTLFLIALTRAYSMFWIVAVLALAAAWFWWKFDYITKNEEDHNG